MGKSFSSARKASRSLFATGMREGALKRDTGSAGLCQEMTVVPDRKVDAAKDAIDAFTPEPLDH